MAIKMDGKALAEKMRAEIREEIAALPRKVTLAVILVGENPASQVYVRNKEKDCADCGFLCLDYHLSADTTETELLELIAQMNDAPEVDGILVQLPLPKHLSEETAIRAIAPEKDVDCFTSENVGAMVQGKARFRMEKKS